MRSQLLFASCAVLGPALAAQSSVVVPAEYARVEGDFVANNYLTGMPWGASALSTPGARFCRVQTLVRFPNRVQGNLRRIAFRRDSSRHAIAKAFSVELEIRCSTTQRTSIDQVFAQNPGKDEVVVFRRRRLDLSPPAKRNALVQPFDVRLIFDRPFAFDSSKGRLLIEYRSYDNTMIDLKTFARSGIGVDGWNHYSGRIRGSRGFHDYGPPSPCYANGKSWPYSMQSHAHIEGLPSLGRTFASWSALQLDPGKPAILAVGSTLLPGKGISLDCGVFQLAPSGIITMIPTLTTSFGTARVPSSGVVEFPWKSWYVGLPTYSQFVTLDTKGKLSATNYYVHHLPVFPQGRSDFGVESVWSFGPNAFTIARGQPTALGKFAQGAVFELTLQ